MESNVKIFRKKVCSLFLAGLLAVIPMNLHLTAFADTSEKSILSCFEDDFNREDGTINGNNGWISECSVLDPPGEDTIKDGILLAKDFSGGNGAATSFSYRPINEAAINQRVSADILNLDDFTYYASANLHVRFVHPANYNSGPDYSYYMSVTNQYICIGRVDHTWSSPNPTVLSEGGDRVYYVRNKKHVYRAELIAEGTYPTRLTATLYDVTAGYVPVATVSGTDSKAEMQVAGVAALGATANGAGNDTAEFDNFKYEYYSSAYAIPDITEICSDDFHRENGDIGNGWVKGAMSGTEISDNVLKLSTINRSEHDFESHVVESAIVRPTTEVALNQVISATFKAPQTLANIGGGIIARCQGETAASDNCYYLCTRLGFDGASNWRTGIYLFNTQECIYQTTDVYMSSDTKYRLELSATSISDTETSLKITMYTYDEEGKETVYFTATVTDNDPVLQKAGTAGISMYNPYDEYINVFNFKYESVGKVISDNEFRFNEKNPIVYKYFEAEAVETYKNSYQKIAGTVDGASDASAVTAAEDVVPTSYEKLTSVLNSKSAYIAYTVYAEKAGTYPIKLRYKFGCDNQSDYNNYVSENGNPYAAVCVNGIFAYQFKNNAEIGEFGTTGEVEVAFNDGVNIIYCMAPTAEIANILGGAFIDYDCLFISGDVKVASGDAVLPGDANFDNKVNIADLVRLKKYFADRDNVSIDETAVDLNSADSVSAEDLIMLRKYLLNHESTEFNELTFLKFNTIAYPDQSEMLNNTYYKLNTDKKLRVAYYGGSVTVGQGASKEDETSWRGLTGQWLKNKYPDADITFTNGAIGGIGSTYGLQHAVSQLKLESETEKPDLVFIEFAINDHYNGENSTSVKNNMEHLIRTIYGYAPQADIIIVLTGELTNMNLDYETKVAHRWIAERYKLPCISVASMLWEDMLAEGNGGYPVYTLWSKYFGTDWVHPNDNGYAKYGEYLNGYLNDIFNAKTAVPASCTDSYIPERMIRF